MIDKLKKFCNSIDIKRVGIANPGPYNGLKEILIKRRDTGHYTEFEEEELNKRIDPRLSLESAKSVIVCLFPYYIGEVEDANISKYTFGLDYHKIVNQKLELIGEYLSNIIDHFEYKAYVDSGPLVDRYMAYEAGLGIFGINSHLITETYGSYVFIGYIINNYPFNPNKPIDRTCIQCGQCVKMCPGGAILGDFNIDPHRCRSYISQKKGELSLDEETILKKDKLVFGCDICQDVCPHNKKISTTHMEAFKENIKTHLDYEEIVNISNKEFMRRYKERAFSWRGRKIIHRNFDIIGQNIKQDDI